MTTASRALQLWVFASTAMLAYSFAAYSCIAPKMSTDQSIFSTRKSHQPATRSKTQLKRKYAAAVAGADDGTKQLLSTSRQAFIDWAVENAVPIEKLTRDDYSDPSDTTVYNAAFLQALKGALQEASVVMLSEGFHNCKEMMTLHTVIVEYLLIKLGFRVVASESGLPESRVISDYLQNEPRKLSCDEEDEIWGSINKMYSAWSEGKDLIDLLIICNVGQLMAGKGDDDFVDYCGLDIGGFYSDWTHPISMIQRYIKQYFPQFERDWSQQMNPLLNALGTTQARYNYQSKLTTADKNKLALLLDELVDMMTSKRDAFDGDRDFEWTRQSAISMQLAENYYRNYEHMSSDDITKKYAGLNGREIAMANNIIWRLNLDCSSEGEQMKMIVINHVIHTKTATQYQDEIWGHFVPMGQMVKQLLDEKGTQEGNKQAVFNIGMIYGGGTFWDKWQRPNERVVATIPPPKDDGLEATMKEISEETGMKNFFIHWETAPSDAYVYLHSVTTIRENDYFIRAFPLEWNGCIYLDHVTHATPDNAYRIN